MFNCWNATRPPRMTATNNPTIRKRRLTAIETRRSIGSLISQTVALGPGRRPVDEQTALGDDLLPAVEVLAHLDGVAVGQTGLDLAKLNRLVVMGNPEPDLLALI